MIFKIIWDSKILFSLVALDQTVQQEKGHVKFRYNFKSAVQHLLNWKSVPLKFMGLASKIVLYKSFSTKRKTKQYIAISDYCFSNIPSNKRESNKLLFFSK